MYTSVMEKVDVLKSKMSPRRKEKGIPPPPKSITKRIKNKLVQGLYTGIYT